MPHGLRAFASTRSTTTRSVSTRPPGARAMAAILAGALISALAAGCTDAPTSAPPPAADRQAASTAASQNEPPAPAGLVTVPFDGALTLWPYLTDRFPPVAEDPVNAIFAGEADPLRIRAALRRLDGDRTAYGFPAAAPFNCTWSDAFGYEQTAYATEEGWTGSAVQLQCGTYVPVRFHLRLFQEGAWTLAGTHFDLHIPGTTDHQVISWELAEQLLVVDMIRSGVLAGPPGLSAPISQAPAFRTIPAVIYNGMPLSLRTLIGGPAAPVSADVPVPNDGRARLFTVGTREPIVPDVATQDFVLQFGQRIPKPLCAAPGELIYVTGPVHFQGEARVTAGGTYHRAYTATGELTVRAVDPATGQPIGPARRGLALDRREALLTPGGAVARMFSRQQLFAADGGGPTELLEVKFSAGTIGHDDYRSTEHCPQ